ncbi:MAG TPA: S41 family peptidase [Candidatus Eisenbacteria bacterium]|nr:S41 family peptidase [Candidatus Eisenbacteria bacterium]
MLRRYLMRALALVALGACPPDNAGAAPPPLSPSDSIDIQPPFLLGNVDVNASAIVFSLAGDLWTIDRTGGRARELTQGAGEDDMPFFSPDGMRIAWTRGDGAGGGDVWVASNAGGEDRQVTFHPKAEILRDWSADGNALLMTCGRDGDGLSRLYRGSPSGGPQTALPLPSGYQGSLSPDGKRLVYQPYSIPFERSEWRYYRGGASSPLWIVDLATSRVVDRLPRKNENLRYPMWFGDRIYYLSDVTGVMNLQVYDTHSKRARALTSFRDHGIDAAGIGPDAIVFTRQGRIHLFDLRTEASREVAITLRTPAAAQAPRRAPLAAYLESAVPSPTGDRLALEARGDILVLDRASGRLRNLTQTPGVAERSPAWAPDGSQLAYFSDASGEYALHVRAADGAGAARVIRIEDHPTFYRHIDWSPDGKRVAFSDARLRLWVVDTRDGAAHVIDQSEYVAQGAYKTTWSQDGAWLAYSKADGRGRRAIFLWSAATSRSASVTDSLAQADNPVFDRTGRYLYLTSSTNARMAPASDIGWALLSSIWYEHLVTQRMHVTVLSKEDPAPYLVGPFTPNPAADTRGLAAATRIDLSSLESRILPLPAPPRDYVELAAGEPGAVYVRTIEWPPSPGGSTPARTPLIHIDLSKPREETKLLDDVDWFQVGGGGKDIVYRVGPDTGWLHLRPDGAADTLAVAIDSAWIEVNPPVEWRQMVREAWRQMRDTFYDPNLHGRDWAALERETSAYLPGITRRQDLNTLLRRMLLQVSVSHLQVQGGDDGDVPRASARIAGDLAVDLEPANGKLRIAKIYRSAPFARANRAGVAALDLPGLNVHEGDYLLAIEGKPLAAGDDVCQFLVGAAGKPTRITVSSRPDTSGARNLTVVPTAGSNTIRRYAWADANRKRVEELSGGRLGYVYVPDYGDGIEDFLAGFLGYAGRVEGLVIDQRFNNGGITPDALIAMLRAEPWYAYRYRYGDDVVVPANTFDGPKVLIINERNGSAAETGALMAKLTGAAILVGTPTYGAGIGAALDQPGLIDGGRIAIPNRASYDPAGSWGIENMGVAPDVRVEMDPASWRAGGDPQLEAAVKAALEALKSVKKRPWKRPPYPVHP